MIVNPNLFPCGLMITCIYGKIQTSIWLQNELHDLPAKNSTHLCLPGFRLENSCSVCNNKGLHTENGKIIKNPGTLDSPSKKSEMR